MTKLNKDFFTRDDVLEISEDLLGKVIFTKIENQITSGIITEVEAYEGITDKASHAYNNRLTERTKTMYLEGGFSYVYLCYGIHHLFNFVTNKTGVPHAILLRAIKPLSGTETMLTRRRKKTINASFSSGPGSAAQALGINTSHNSISLLENTIWVEDQNIQINKTDIIKSPRIGVDYAQEDALLDYNFRIKI